MLIPFPIALWVFSLIADVVYLWRGNPVWRDYIAFYALLAGIVGNMEALRTRQTTVRFIQVRHEEAAALMACEPPMPPKVLEAVDLRAESGGARDSA